MIKSFAPAAASAAAALAAVALLLAGCASSQISARPTHQPSSEPSAATAAFPTGQPPRPGVPNLTMRANTVPGLTGAITRASHPGLQICQGHIDSFILAKGDLRGNGSIQYLVDTTCDKATATTPDEVSLYDGQEGVISRSAVIYEFSANRPRTTAYPYMWKKHFVVLTYDGGKEYRLVLLTPDKVIPGLVESFQ